MTNTITGQFVKTVERVSRDGQKKWLDYVFKDQMGQEITMSHWGKALDLAVLQNTPWLKVTYTENAQGYKNLGVVSPTDPPTAQSGVAQHNAPPQSAQASAPVAKVSTNLSVSRQYLALKLAVELVKVEGVTVDKKLERCIEAYKKFLAELDVTE